MAELSLDNTPYNPIGVEQVAALDEAVTRLGADRSVRAIIINGAGGKHFSLGANLKQADAIAAAGSLAFCQQRHDLYRRIELLEKPVIASISGYCLGGGLELALACHFRYADASARLALPEVELGTAPLWGGAYRVVRTVGRAAGLDMLLTGRHVEADEALRLGLLHQCYENHSELEAGVWASAEALAAKAPLAVAAILRVVNGQQGMGPEEALSFELQEFDKLSGTRDNIEGISALFEKREPHFVGE
ncbi:enoyl-CoA hydratase/isomerase family protein [Candidatus Litorirhabdus singularis]|uniref:enoyl-CoA hydratase/isomerase family protein n=1 Tax=Candidatus Litorirhabdus singularis TaxID=2518993 RepID=UPI00242B1448|nr:enoyl-CoA hydratase/isomerase family protein [Candidatus Litorirhabdus singularis]